MPKSAEHEQQAEKNEELSEELLNEYSDYDDWVITTRFYTAIHFIESELTKRGYNSGTHRERKENIKDSNLPDNIMVYKEYRNLEDLSRDTRYECVSVTSGDLNGSERSLNLIKKKLGFFSF